jgi:low temperature requirement protein LtrA
MNHYQKLGVVAARAFGVFLLIGGLLFLFSAAMVSDVDAARGTRTEYLGISVLELIGAIVVFRLAKRVGRWIGRDLD